MVMDRETVERLLDDLYNEIEENKEFIIQSKVNGTPPRQDVSQYSIKCVQMDRIERAFNKFHNKLDDYEKESS